MASNIVIEFENVIVKLLIEMLNFYCRYVVKPLYWSRKTKYNIFLPYLTRLTRT